MRTTDVTQKIGRTWEEAGAQDVLEERDGGRRMFAT